VKRQAVIAHSIEQIVLADDGREATKIMASGTRPDKVKQCFYLLGSTGAKSMSYTGGSRDLKDVNVSLWRGPPRMKTDVEQQIRFDPFPISTSWDPYANVEIKLSTGEPAASQA
jgi:hypothetical protein